MVEPEVFNQWIMYVIMVTEKMDPLVSVHGDSVHARFLILMD